MSKSEQLSGAFINLAGERYYAIGNVDQMPPFLISLVSDNDHWMFVASNGGLTAGRESPANPLFPYITVDKIYDSVAHTGCKTLLRTGARGQYKYWEPFNSEHDGSYVIRRNLYKNSLGNKILFEEINEDLQLAFRYSWATSQSHGFIRQAELENLGDTSLDIEFVDGLQNLLPANTPRFTQTNASYLVDAYKWSELDEQSGLGLFTLFSGISDRAEPCESLEANSVFVLGFNDRKILLSTEQLNRFRRGETLNSETNKRGIRGAYFVNAAVELSAKDSCRWQLIANLQQSQSEVVDLMQQLKSPQKVAAQLAESIDDGSDALARIMASADGFQYTAEENVTTHHYANVLFNILRGGIADDQYQISKDYFCRHVQQFNAQVYARQQSFLDALPGRLSHNDLLIRIDELGDPQLVRLAYEYLPFTFGRRHGDPSRPWNQFTIRLADEQGNRALTYEGNWRDIFQNWEALLFSYPEFTENIIAKFVNASTVDGYNPYRITNEGIDWEVEDLEDPWSYIGYWGDHQIIYLQKLLELSQQFHPQQLDKLLHEPIFSYANVPYRIKPLAAILENAKSTVEYDYDLAARIEQRVESTGSDGKLLLDSDGQVYQVTLLEKLLVTLLAKLANLVIDGGIWLNTQRPEWNDANNALVGQGLSMVTLYYLRRYVAFLQQLLSSQSTAINLSADVSQWLEATAAILKRSQVLLGDGPIDAERRYQVLVELGQAASDYRGAVYAAESLSGTVEQEIGIINSLLADAQAAIDHTIGNNVRAQDGMFHAYNLLELKNKSADIDTLYVMLEGQVAALSSGAVAPAEAVRSLEALFHSQLFRDDQESFLLYPDRELPGFLEKNCVPPDEIKKISLLQQMLEQADSRIIERDASGTYRFNSRFTNFGDLKALLSELAPDYGATVEAARKPLQELYESVFNHKAFTGRSGGMFGFEGLGSIYWHMVAKLLLAVQENFFAARQHGADKKLSNSLGSLYYRIRHGIGFNKTPGEYGAFPTDPYSHTPKHAGAQQPGMTGQVKEELLARFGELGVRVESGIVSFDPALLRECEFTQAPTPFRFLDVHDQWQELPVPRPGLAFTWCQVPITYRLETGAKPIVTVTEKNDEQTTLPALCLTEQQSRQIFQRSGQIRMIELVLSPEQLLSD